MDFGRMLKTLRLSAGIGLREFSRIIEVSPTYLSLVENGKQSPPNALRVMQIEDALKVPPGCLSSLTNNLGAATAAYLEEVPESVDFLQVAERNSMTSADFMKLTGFLNRHGWEVLEQTIQGRRRNDADGRPKLPEYSDENGCGASGLYIWPFLRERLIFSVDGARDKEEFLRTAIDRIARRSEGVDGPSVIEAILARERITSTGIGEAIAVPHAYLPELKDMIVALAGVPEGLDFDSIDGRPVRLAIILAGPKSAENIHLKLLAKLAKLVSYGSFRRRLLATAEPGKVIEIFRSAEAGIS
jgi:mannitol/fructose-specific phosphotransferase system IIA component (Ntr-type)/transcriptional regulator with XRE-family HTH domain